MEEISDKYKTISESSEGFFKDRLSKFYAFAFPVSNEDEIKEIRDRLRKKYHDARHHVYAFRLGSDKNIFRYSDDGEPANSSGPPVFNAIKSFDVSDILIVVIRYFGGKKLGIPGLINAYNSAAKEALENAKLITKTIEEILNLDFEFNQLNLVMRGIKKNNLKIVSQKFTSKCSINISIRKSKKIEIINYFKNININIQ